MGSDDGCGYSKQIAYNTAGTVVTLLCQWLIIMVLPKISDFSEAGIFAVAISVCSILNHVATFSLKEFQISDRNLRFTDADYRIVRLTTIGLSFAMIVPFVLLFGYGMKETAAILGYMVYRNLLHYAYIYSAALQIHGRLYMVGIHSAVEGVLSFLSFVAVYLATEDLVISIFAMAAVGGGAFLLLQYRQYRDHVPHNETKYDRGRSKALFLIGIPLLFSILFPTFTTALPKLILQNQWGDSLAGIFSTLSTPTIIIPTLAISVFAPFIVYFSDLARADDIARIRKKYTVVTAGILGFGLLSVVLSVAVQSWVFETLYGDEMIPYAKYFAYLMAGITVYTVGTVGTTVLITKNQGAYAAPLAFIAFIVGAVSCMVLIPDDGIEGATCSLMLAYTVFGVLISLCVYLMPLKKHL